MNIRYVTFNLIVTFPNIKHCDSLKKSNNCSFLELLPHFTSTNNMLPLYCTPTQRADPKEKKHRHILDSGGLYVRDKELIIIIIIIIT